jgi:hypothetical protein
MPTFHAPDFSDRTNAPDDVIPFAESLIDLVKGSAVPLVCGEALLADLEGRVQRAEQTLLGSKRGLVLLQELQAATREAAAAFHALLVPMRLALRAVIGASHRDYQELRTHRASHEDEREEEALSTAEAAVSTSTAAPQPSQPAQLAQADRVSVTNGHA